MAIYCPRCGNNKQDKFGNKAGVIYCRICLDYRQPEATILATIQPKKATITLPYALTKEQREIAFALLKQKQDTYLKAVCGAGKTEIVFPSIYKALAQGKRVGIAIPRKEVVKELYQRIQQVFQGVKVVAVYGGHDADLEGDIVVLTTHQTYRYPQKFGLLIIDEYDAFPFVNNPTLQHFTKRSCYGKSIYLSATFQEEEIKDKTYFELNKRHHQHPLPLPVIEKVSEMGSLFKIYCYLQKYQYQRHIFIYVPTIKDGKKIATYLTLFKIRHIFFSSQSEKEVYQAIQQQHYRVVITTTILERGITMANLHVLVYKANHFIFDFKTLIQIAGRVGRKSEYPTGDIIFYSKQVTPILKQVCHSLVSINENLSSV